VTVIRSADIVDSGLTTVADVIRTLPADNGGTLPTAFPGAFAAGASGIALRGLTVNSTLVLIDSVRAADHALLAVARHSSSFRAHDLALVAQEQHLDFSQFLLNSISLSASIGSAALRQQRCDHDCCGSKSPTSSPAAEPRTMSSISNLREKTRMRISRRVNCPGVRAPANDAARTSRLLAAAGAMIGSLIGASAMGQQAPASSSSDTTELQEVVVTGSMIKRVNAETAEAVTVVKMDTLKDLGVTTVEQALALVTANNATVTTGSNVATFNGGASVASLRGMGATKTLVLLDGQRLANNVTLGSGVDLNTIPFQAIDHIEVLREGASSLYGSDAIAGVINFITKKDYTGGEVNLNYSHPEHPGGSSDNADLTYGIGNLASDGYNLMITGNFTQQKEMTPNQRPFASTGYNPALGLANFNGPYGPWPGSFQDNATAPSPKGPVSAPNLWQIGYPTCAGNPHLVATGGSCQYLYSAAVDLIPQSSSESGLVAFTKTLPGNNTLSIQYFYSRFDLRLWTGPQEYSFSVDPSSPYYPKAANATCVGGCSSATPVFNPTGGAPLPITAGWTDPNNNRVFGNINTEQRALVTFAGSNGGWDYTTAFDWSENKGVQQVRGGEANYETIAPGGTLSNLINPFGPQSAAGQALINSAYTNGNLEVGTLSLYDLNGHASHALGDAFNAGRPAQFAVGFDYRDEQISDVPTQLATTLYTATYFPPTLVTGSRVSEAAYLELNVPVTSQAEFTVSDREDRYSDFGTTNNAKVSFAYSPIEMLKIRGAASTGFRAPTLVEEYSPNTFGAVFGNMVGPGCASGNYTTVFSKLNCISQGLSLNGGNTNLKPETSQNFDLGFVLQPLSNLDLTLDYYRINLRNEIQTLPGATIYGNPTTFAGDYVLNNAGTLSPASLSNIQCPHYTAPTCGYIITTQQNTGSVVTDGIDLSSNYVLATDYGKFRVNYEGNFVTGYRLTEYPGGPALSLVGQFNEGNQPVIRYRHVLTLDWTLANWGAGLSNDFTEHYHDYLPDAAGNILTVGNYSIWNAYGSYRPIPALKLLVGINNLADTNPPFSNQEQNWQAGYNPLFSSALGRTFYGRITFDF
jgi:iron complex outermembrane recepter protein